LLILLALAGMATVLYASTSPHGQSDQIVFPRALDSYHDNPQEGVLMVIKNRAQQEPFNVVASLIFFCAIIHTFLTSKFMALSHDLKERHNQRKKEGGVDKQAVHFGAEVLHFFGDVEAVFGIWAVVLAVAITFFYDWNTFIYYIGDKTNYTEPVFVVVIMTLASTRPVLKLSELAMWKIANLIGGNLTAWWLTIMTVGPILGSFITEPAAMTISALLLSSKFYNLQPSSRLKYATIGLLFVNISVGGTLSHFAAPPVLMVSTTWNWDFGFMIGNFGWKAFLGIIVSNLAYYFLNRTEIQELEKKYAVIRAKRDIESKYIKREKLESVFSEIESIVSDELKFASAFDQKAEEIKVNLKVEVMERVEGKDVDVAILEEAFERRFEDIKLKEMRRTLPALLPEEKRPPYRDPYWDNREDWVPGWVMLVHVCFLAWTVVTAHHPALFIAGFLFLLGFIQATNPYQNRINLKPPLLVGFFLGGLIIHGGVQAWWIAPVLGSLPEIPLMLGATLLTAFNDNAAITYLSTLVPNLSEGMKYAVVAGAVTGGGLTVIANAPNPAGQSILGRYFENGISPAKLFLAAILPTIFMGLSFMLLRF